MNTKMLLSLAGGAVAVVGLAYFVLAPYAKTVEDAQNVDVPNQQERGVTEGAFAPQFKEQEDIKTEVTDITETESTVVPPAEVITPTSKPAVTPVTVTAKPTTSPYTTATVSIHNNETSCWSIINGNVYDLTSFATKHPGGERNILKICGKDGSAAFMGQHGGDSKPETTLEKYYLGKLTN